MADISAKDVAALRKQTGAGMMDCKKALTETGGDLEAAKTWLREHNLAGATKRAGREAEEGAVDVVVDGRAAAIVELVCETDFVAKGDLFRTTVAKLALLAASSDTELGAQDYDGSTVTDAITQLSGTLGEKIAVGRIERFTSPDGILDGYKHIQNDRGTIAVLVELGGVDINDEKAQEVAHDIALHIASAAPRWVSRDDVPADVVEQERKVLEALTRNEGKPEAAIGKIVEGRLGGFFKDNCLVDQGFVREPKTTVGSLITSLGADATVRRFARIKIGED
jgi:elongation factor Ts